jgi:cell division protein FtsQ
MGFLRRHAGLLAGLGLGVLVLAGGFFALRDSSLFAVREVSVSGLNGSQADEVRVAITDAARTMTTLHVREGALRTAVEPYPVVRNVSAHADLFHRLHVTVHAYTPIGAVQLGGHLTAIASDGTVLDGAPTRGLAVVAGDASAAGTRITSVGPARMLSALGAAPPALRSRATRVWNGPRGMAVQMRQGPRIDLGDTSRLAAKWLALAAVLEDGAAKGASYIDVRVPDRPVAGPLPPAPTEDPSDSSTSG